MRFLLWLLLLGLSVAPTAQQDASGGRGNIAAQMGGEWKDVPYKVHSKLHDDCLQGNVTAVKEALEAGSKYINERRGSAFNTPLHNAATKSNLEIARLLVEVGASPIQQATPDGTFHVRLGHEVANINARNEIEATPLMFAAGSNQTEMMLYLMDHGADFSLQTESGGTAMHFAVRTNNSELVAAFLDKVAAMNGSMAAPDSTSTTAVEAAVDEPGTTSAMDLVRIVNHANNQGWVPLHFAARQGSAAIAKLLIDRGADMDAVELRGYNSLLVAAALQQYEVASFLLKSGADATKQDDGQLGGKTALEHMPRLREELRR